MELCLDSLVGRTVSIYVPKGGCGLSKSLESLSADKQGLSISSLVWGITTLETASSCWGQVLLLVTQARCLPGEFMQMNTPWYICHQRLCPQSESQPPLTSLGDPPRQASRSGPSFYEISIFALGPRICEILSAPFKSEVSISPSPVELLQSGPTGLQSQMLWGLPFLMPDA